jgi:MinD superfamily P-loop ATPase
MARELRIPFGVFINRCDIGTRDTEKYCEKNAIPVLGKIPDDRMIAESYSRGEVIGLLLLRYGGILLNIADTIRRNNSNA